MNWFNKTSRMFSKCFWSRIGSNSFFGEKSMNLVFLGRIVGVPDNASFVEEKMLRLFCFLTIGADDELRKKKSMRDLIIDGPDAWPDLPGPTTPDLISFLVFKF